MRADDLKETTVPRTSNGQEYAEWAKLLDFVDPEARDPYGFDGTWLGRGTIVDLLPGSIVLECAGFRTKRDERDRNGKLYVLWKFDGDGWEELARSKDRDWAKHMRSIAIPAIEEASC